MFRIAIHEIKYFAAKKVGSDTNVSGSFSKGFIKMMNTLRFNYSLVWTKDPSERSGQPNATSGLYNGALGHVQRDEADVVLWAELDTIPVNEPFHFGPTQRHVEGAIASKVMVTFDRADLLKSMMCVSPTIALFVLVALSLCASLIALNEGNVKARWAMNVWRLFRLIFAQTHYRPIKVLSQALIALIAATSMFFMFYWENSMATDMFAPDTSQIIRTLDDILRNESLKVLMIKGSSMYEQFRDASRLTKYGKIFQMASQYESSFNEIKSKDKLGKKLRSDMYRRDSVLIETTDALKLLAESTCWSNPNEGNFSISSEKFLSAHVTPVYGKNLSSAKRTFLDMRVFQAFESGLTSLIYQKYATSLKSTLEDEGMLTSKIAKALKKCIISDLQLYISELQKALHLDQMSNQALIGLWAMTAAGLAVATLVAVVEKLSPKGKTVKKAKTNRFFYKRQ